MNKGKLFKNSCLSFIVIFLLCGCYRYIIGTEVTQPEKGQKGRYSQNFNYSYSDCFTRTKKVLCETGVSVYYESLPEGIISAKNFNGIFKNCIDTTEVGIFFKETGPGKTQVDIACGNINLAEFAAKLIFKNLEEELSQDETTEEWQ